MDIRGKFIILWEKIANIKFVLLIFGVISLIYLEIPGLYLDAVNPDYFGLHVLHSENVPQWAYSDNVIATFLEGNTEYSHFPILNSLYGTCFEAYFMMIWAIFFGYGVYAIRTLHILYVLILILGVYFLLKYLFENQKINATIATFLLAMEPSLVFSERTQFYIQLFPHIFFLFGLLLIIKSITTDENKKRNGICGAILLGLSASSYFIFVFYFIAAFFSCIIIKILQKEKWFKQSINWIIGFFIGFLPYIYAHISIILTQGIGGWIIALKGLDAYGLSDGAQASLIERFQHICKMFGNIAGGASIIQIMTGGDIGYTYGKIFALVYMCAVVASIYVLIKKRKEIASSKTLMALIILDNILLWHCLLSLIIGNALGYQHFIMLLPIMYLTIVIVTKELCRLWISINRKGQGIRIIMSFSTLCLIVISAERLWEGYSLIEKTNGYTYYSEAINDLAYYLDGVVTDSDVIVSPQWGYWMQIACVTQGEKLIWVDTDKDALQWRIDTSTIEGKFFVVVDTNTDVEMIEGLMSSNGYQLEGESVFKDFGEVLLPTVQIYEK